MRKPSDAPTLREEHPTLMLNVASFAAQSANIIFDSQRMKGMPDAEVERELRKYTAHIKAIKRLWFVNRNREIIDIK